MATEEIAKILSCIGGPVCYVYPETDKPRNGILEDRSVFASGPLGDVPYWDVVDLIKFEDEPEKLIRIGYYRKRPGRPLNFSGQTTITDTVSNWKGLLVKAAREKEWFRNLLDDVMDELENPPTH